MPVFDHLGITVDDVARADAQFGPIMSALGFIRNEYNDTVSWDRDGETELILYPPRELDPATHVHGRVGWQHLAFAVDSRDEVDRFHRLALDAGWTAVRDPKEYPRFSDRYYASFVEDACGIRLEFMHNPPRPAAD
ncbi:VOC family protein [Microbacterium sp. GXF7504]